MGGQLVRQGCAGTGPGSITPDGCAVELYSRLSVGTGPEVIGSVLRPGASVLERGCGAGRVTHPPVGQGFAVTAVDESAQMPERARTVRSPIGTLDLGEERFDAVVLGSFLVHTSDHRVGEGLLGTCRGHVKGDRVVLIQREGADYRVDLPRERGGPGGRLHDQDPLGGPRGERRGDGVDEAREECVFEDVRWTQTFRSRALSVEQFEGYLDEAGWSSTATSPRTRVGAVVDRHLTPDGGWAPARPALP